MEKKRSLGIGKFFRSIILTVFILILAGSFVVFYYLREQQKIIQNLEDRIKNLKETSVPLRFMILPDNEGIIKARFRFYSADGKEISVFEQAWEGDELVIDSMVVPVADKYIAFPSKVFTDAVAPRDGMLLFSFYDRQGFPEIYGYDGLDENTRQSLKELFQQVISIESIREDLPFQVNVREKELEKNMFGNAVHDIKRIKTFEKGRVYALAVHTKGGIEIIEE